MGKLHVTVDLILSVRFYMQKALTNTYPKTSDAATFCECFGLPWNPDTIHGKLAKATTYK